MQTNDVHINRHCASSCFALFLVFHFVHLQHSKPPMDWLNKKLTFSNQAIPKNVKLLKASRNVAIFTTIQIPNYMSVYRDFHHLYSSLRFIFSISNFRIRLFLSYYTESTISHTTAVSWYTYYSYYSYYSISTSPCQPVKGWQCQRNIILLARIQSGKSYQKLRKDTQTEQDV